ncbi:MAG: DoxX family membrane protein [Candidatus Eremiobacteraeota bacterium]|nr:DoxX family membrane protein [Candidatus Eremiobacteraeota bacterium]
MISRALLVLPRLYLGVIFAVAVTSKLESLASFPRSLAGFVQHAGSPLPFYATFVSSVVVPHAPLFAFLVIMAENYVAIGMLFGVTTRAASLAAIFLLCNYMLAKGMPPWSPASNDAADIVIAIVVGAGAAGRVLGFDKFLAERWPRAWVW